MTAIWSRIRAALKRNRWALWLNAWLEWIILRARFRYQARLDGRKPPRPDGYPLPPPSLRYRVHGSIDHESFLTVGSRCATDILSALESHRIRLEPGAEILDFGCGCGRVLRNLLRLRPDWRYTGADIDDEAIAWCREAYPGAAFLTTPTRPPTALPDRSFDLIIGISVLTHLDEEYQDAWLQELHRIVRPGGHVLLSVRSDDEANVLPEEDRARLRRDGILHTSWRTGKLKLDGLPDFYQTTYHTREYVERAWTRRLTLVAYLPRAINDDHDAVILQRGHSAESSALVA